MGGTLFVNSTGSPARFTKRDTSTTGTDNSLDVERLTTGDMAAGYGAEIRFVLQDGTSARSLVSKIAGVRGTADTEGELLFFAGTTGEEEFMRIAESGNVGIGTASPDQELHVVGNANVSGTLYVGNVSDIVRSMLKQDEWTDLPLNGGWTNESTGSGTVTQEPRTFDVRTGTTATSTAWATSTSAATEGWSSGQSRQVINWDKTVIVNAMLTTFDHSANGEGMLSLGKGGDDNIGNLAGKAIAIKANTTRALFGQVHDGTTLTHVDLNTVAGSGIPYRATIISDGTGNVEWLIDGVSKGTTSAGPTGLPNSGESLVQVEADNGGDTSNNIIIAHSIKVYVEQ
tara:strand:+ start:69 stop:1097 length:1029 start_codon:yes stop_codon:yes gene_type:complete